MFSAVPSGTPSSFEGAIRLAAAGIARHMPYAAGVAILAAIYFAAAELGFSLAGMHENVSLVWPPTGIALAALLRLGYRLWPGIALGAFLANALTEVPLATAAGIAVGNTLEGLSGAYLLRRFAGFQNSLDRLEDVLGLVALGAGLSTTVSATIGVASLCLGGAAPWALYGSLWWQWWLGDAMGALVVAPVLLTWGMEPRVTGLPWRLAEAGALLLGVVAVSRLVFWGWFTAPAPSYPLTYAVFPFVIWAALRFGHRGAAPVTLVVSGMAITGTVQALGPFGGGTLTERLMLLQTFMSVVAVTALVLAAVITHRRRVEEALQDREARVRFLLDQLPAIIWVTDPTLRVTLMQGAGLTTVKLEPHQVVGTTVSDPLSQEPETPALAAHRRALRGEPCSYEVELQGRLFQAYVEPMRAPNGGIAGCLGIALDITERKRAEAALRASEATARGILEAAAEGILMADRQGRVTLVNAKLEEMFAYRREELLGQNVEILLPERLRETHAGHRAGYFMEPRKRPMGRGLDLVGRRKDGTEFPIEVGLSYVESEDGIVAMASVTDITERKRTEDRLILANRGLETLLRVISHDLKEPLRAIETFSSIVHERYASRLDEKGQDLLRRTVKATARMSLLLEDILTLSRVRGTSQLTEEIEGEALVREALERLKEPIEKTGAKIRVAPALPRLLVDRTWATQAIYNLLSNALKFTREGEAPDVEVALYHANRDDPRGVGIAVRDRGPGVAAEDAERIFDLFQRAVGREVEGTGAGLAIVREVAKRHSGHAWVRPRAGGGSEFIITFGTGKP